MTKRKNILMEEDAEYGVDSRYISSKARKSDAVVLMEARLNRMRDLSKEQIIRAKLVQLKLKMVEYLKNPVCGQRNYFSEFLAAYIDTVYPQRSTFAKDIDIAPVSLSQVINNHREPNEEFIRKLMIHSEMVFKSVCEFRKEYWYQVYFQEKICNTLSNQDIWRPEIEKHVRLSEAI